MKHPRLLLAAAIALVAPLPAACSSPGPDMGDVATDAGTPGSAHEDAGSEPAGPIAAAMNDVSILFPLPSSVADITALLGPASSGARGRLFPAPLYSSPAVGPIAGSSPLNGASVPFLNGPAGGAAYADLRVTATRIDPCFGSSAPDPHGGACAAQIRLTFQEVRNGDDGRGVTTADSALHAFYALTRDEFLTLARALVALRVTNQGAALVGPLAPHPIMVAQGLLGPMAKGVSALILHYAGEQNLVRAAQLSGSGAEIILWSFSAVDVRDAAAAATSPFAIPTLKPVEGWPQFPYADDAGTVIAQVASPSFASDDPHPDAGSEQLTIDFTPTTTSAESFAPLDRGPSLANISASELQTALDALAQVENPAENTATTIDCASCHFATPTEAFIARPMFSFDETTSPLAFEPDGKSVVPSDMATTFPGVVSSPSTQFSVHAFSYFGRYASINQRVVNETAAVVEYLNDLPE